MDTALGSDVGITISTDDVNDVVGTALGIGFKRGSIVDGSEIGCIEGLTEDSNIGTSVDGLVVRTNVGSDLGFCEIDGISEGLTDGILDGITEGLDVGFIEGVIVGDTDGGADGFLDGAKDGD